VNAYLMVGQQEHASRVFNEIPRETDFTYPDLAVPPSSQYPLSKLVSNTLDLIIERASEDYDVKVAKSLRAIATDTWSNDVPPEILERKKADLIAGLEILPGSTLLNTELGRMLEMEGDLYGAARHYITAQLRTDATLAAEIEFWDKLYRNKSKFTRLSEFVFELIKSPFGQDRSRFAKFFLGGIVNHLRTQKAYAQVISWTERFSHNELVAANIIFETAFAYAELGKDLRAAELYETYLKEAGENAGVMNNLALLRERQGRLVEATALLQRAVELDSRNEQAPSNLARLNHKLQVQQARETTLKRAADIFWQEDRNTRTAIAAVYSETTDEETIVLKTSRIATLFGAKESEVPALLNSFVDRGYFVRAENAPASFNGFALRVNTALSAEVQKQLEVAEEERFHSEVSASLSSENLNRSYGYNDDLKVTLQAVASPDLFNLLSRDTREAVLALATGSYKSALILSGSIAEALLHDKLSQNETAAVATLTQIRVRTGQKISSRDKNLSQWNLAILLDVAREQKLVSENLYHWGHGVRGFRNLVHPAVEQRREMDASKESAEIAWSVVKRLLRELS
jgi:tetratricopeptide (TPR) repeat protein